MTEQRLGELRDRMLRALQRRAQRGVRGGGSKINARWIAWVVRQRATMKGV